AGEVGGEVAHEFGELLSVVDPGQKMHMVRRDDVAEEPDVVEALGAAEDAEGDVIEGVAGGEEEAALDGPAGDLDQGAAFWDESDRSGHTEARSRSRLVPNRPIRRNALNSKRLSGFGGNPLPRLGDKRSSGKYAEDTGTCSSSVSCPGDKRSSGPLERLHPRPSLLG